MKNIIFKLTVFTLAAVIINSCSEKEPLTYQGPNFITFTDGSMGEFFVQEDNAPYLVQVGMTVPQTNDVTVDIGVISASGEAGTHYDLPSSITIPAGEVVANISVQGYFENMTQRKDTLIFELLGDIVGSYDTAYTVYIQQFCPFVVDEFLGDWTAYEQSDYEAEPYDPYTITFEANPNGGDTLITDDIWPNFPVKVTFDDSNPASFIWNIPDQFLVDDLFGYGEARITDLGAGPFSACDKTMRIRYKVYVSAGNFEQSTLELVKN